MYQVVLYISRMIKSWRSRHLKAFFETGNDRRVGRELASRVKERLDVLRAAGKLEALNLPGYRLHELKGMKPARYAIWVSGAWRITFEFENGDAYRVDLEQYH